MPRWDIRKYQATCRIDLKCVAYICNIHEIISKIFNVFLIITNKKFEFKHNYNIFVIIRISKDKRLLNLSIDKPTTIAER